MHTLKRLPLILMSVAVLCLAAAPVPASAAPARAAAGAQTGAALPADVNSDSRNRLATSAPDPDGGPTAAAAAIRGAGTGVNARWESPVGRPLLELAILITAREHDAPFEWSLHEMEAVAVGLDPAVIDVVRNREPVSGLGDREAVIIEAGREIFGAHRLSAETYRRAVTLFGEANFVDVVDLMARYAGTAARLAAFNQQMPPGWPQFLPLPFTPPDDLDPRSRSRLPLLLARPRRRGPRPASTAAPSRPRGRGRGRSAATARGGRRSRRTWRGPSWTSPSSLLRAPTTCSTRGPSPSRRRGSTASPSRSSTSFARAGRSPG